MKRVFAICLATILMFCFSAAAFATPNGFVSSPSGNSDPTVEDFEPDDAGCTGHVVITAYVNKSQLPAELEDLIDKAYEDITEAKELTELNAAFADYVESKDIDAAKLAVSDLFDARIVGCNNNHESHHGFKIVIAADTLENFVGFLHMNHDGEWEFVDNAKVINNGKSLEFYVDTLSPFAIVVEANKEPLPYTGDSNMIYLWASVMVVSLTAVVVIVVKGNKRKHSK